MGEKVSIYLSFEDLVFAKQGDNSVRVASFVLDRDHQIVCLFYFHVERSGLGETDPHVDVTTNLHLRFQLNAI